MSDPSLAYYSSRSKPPRLRSDLHPLPALRSWLNSWRGIGSVERGMAHQGYDLQLTRYDNRGWRATFYTTGMECQRSPNFPQVGSSKIPHPGEVVVATTGLTRPALSLSFSR